MVESVVTRTWSGSAAQHAPGQRALVLTVTHEHGAVHEGEVVAGRLLDPTAGAVGEVVDVLRRAELEAVEVDDVDVGVRALLQPTPAFEAEQVGALRGEHLDALLDAPAAGAAHPAGEEVGGLAGVLDLA